MMKKKIQESTNFIINKINKNPIPVIAIILGSGLGDLSKKINPLFVISYSEIPFFPKTTIDGHSGKLIYSEYNNKKILIISGRFHYYEGHSIYDIVYPIRVIKNIGINNIILSNACGGVNPNFRIGDIMFIKDHINLFPKNPLRGKNIDIFGSRFVDMQEVYNKEMIFIAEQEAIKNKISYHKGIYVSLQGPNFETQAEYDMIRKIGGDAVGMSTVPEVIVSKQMNMKIFAISIITNLGGSIFKNNSITKHEDVLAIGKKALESVFLIITGIIKKYC